MLRLSYEQISKKIEFIEHYLNSANAADGSKVDSNANVTSKNIATMEAELNKDINIQVNRALVKQKIATLYGEDLAQEYIRQIESHDLIVLPSVCIHFFWMV